MHLLSRLTGAVVLALYLPLRAEPTTPPTAKLAACISCHGAKGESSAGDIPNLAGQKRDYLIKQLQAFKAGERKNELMQAMATQLSAEDIRGLAEHWSRLPAVTVTAEAQAASGIPSRMQFPAGFPAGLVEYDREIDHETKVVFVRYANPVALEAARAGKPQPSGAVIMTGEYAAVVDARGAPRKDADGRWMTAGLQSVSGMQAEKGWGDGVPDLLRNGDWNYGLWSPSGQSRLAGNHARCLACHQPLRAQDHVFTLAALRQLAMPATPPASR